MIFFYYAYLYIFKNSKYWYLKKNFTGRNFEGRTLLFLHLVAYLYLHKTFWFIFQISNSFSENIKKKSIFLKKSMDEAPNFSN